MFKRFLKKVPGAKALNMYLLEKRIQSNFLTLNNVDTKQVKFYSQFKKLGIIRNLEDRVDLWSYNKLDEVNRISTTIKNKLKDNVTN